MKLGVKDMTMRLLLLVFTALSLFSGTVNAQFYNGSHLTFGKNRIQYNSERIWSTYRFEKFDVYFYQEGRPIAINVAKYAHEIYPEISATLDYTPSKKIHFVVFNRLSELKSSNIGMDNDVLYNVGGDANIVDYKVFLYFDGSYTNLFRQIRFGIASVMVNNMLYGDQIGSNVKNSALMTLPDWYINGLVSYIAEPWSVQNDMKLKDGILNGRFKKFNQLEGENAVLAGHSVWRFIGDSYGNKVIPGIIYMTKISRNVESGMLFVIGMSFKSFMRSWFEYYSQAYKADASSGTDPFDADAKVIKTSKKRQFYNAKLSPDGRYIAYVTDRLNKKYLKIYDQQTGKSRTLFKQGPRVEEQPDFSYPLMAWHPSSRILAYFVENKGRTVLYLYNLEDHSKEKFYIDNVSKVTDFSYSPRGNSMVMSAVINGQSDIFIFTTASRTFERVTKDYFDDYAPRFIDNGNKIAFLSNRTNDTISILRDTYLKDNTTLKERPNRQDIYVFDYATKNPVLFRVTNTPDIDESNLVDLGKNGLAFIDESSGIPNISVAVFDSSIAYVDTIIHYRYNAQIRHITNFSTGISEFEVTPDQQSMLSLFIRNGRPLLISQPFDAREKIDSLKNSSYVKTLVKQKVVKTPSIQKGDSVKKSKTVVNQGYYEMSSDTDRVNVHNYQFVYGNQSSDNQSKKNRTEEENTALEKKKAEKAKADSVAESKANEFVLSKQLNYNVEYSIDKLVSQLDFSYLNTTYQNYTGYGPIFNNAGTTVFLQMGGSDILEDYRIVGGIRTQFDLSNNEYFFSFENMKYRLDRQVVLHRMSYESQEGENTFLKHHLHDVHYILKWPFSQVLALKGSGIFKYDNIAYRSSNLANLKKPDIENLWGGLKLELVFDNTRNPVKNIYYGTRYKIFAEYYQGINQEKLNLINVGIDYRHYTKIHRTLILANRFAAATSLGSTRLLYIMGGVDNWFIPRYEEHEVLDTSMNFSFQTLATNMRGFKQNVRNGNSFAILNSELRFPVFRYLFNRPLKSEFLNNFQVVCFADYGAAWFGLNPFSDINTIIPEYYYQKPILVTVKSPRNPFVAGFGSGLRTSVMGYFLRLDLAWGIEENSISKPKLMLSFSLDF